MTIGGWCDVCFSPGFWVRCSEQWGARLMDGLFTAEWRRRGRGSSLQSCSLIWRTKLWRWKWFAADMKRNWSYQYVLQDESHTKVQKIRLKEKGGELTQWRGAAARLKEINQPLLPFLVNVQCYSLTWKIPSLLKGFCFYTSLHSQ